MSQLGATPVLTLACVASAPLCPPETRAGALRDVARIAGLAVNNGGIEPESEEEEEEEYAEEEESGRTRGR